ncbi:hypothetical protein QYE76_069968 [Lolium multiflorum]|uniref:Transposase (putative) gypsy type domain-containing protein n=1 Tax=Lolium multiflorum TaxID=4521 RepID=A0AAD8SIH2_LOLMU|nr:hypothetical protein QYE76_069968 [Lolium multiflorum]
MAIEDLEWERSKISNQDMNLLKRLGFTKEKDALGFPHEESYPKPPMEYRVSFVDHLIHGLSPPIHEFLRGLLFVYGLQLHHLTPNSILHVSIFIILCECFLGVQPNRALWKRIFCLRRNGSHGVAYNIGGGVIISFFVDTLISPAASPKGKRKRDEAIDSGTSKANTSRAGKSALNAEEETLDLYGAALVSSDDEEEDAPIDETARTSTSRRTHQEYELENPEDDELLDALSLLEIHGTEARNGLDEAEAGLSRLFPYFFHKRSNLQLSLILPSASLAKKTLDSNFVKKD